MKIPSALMMTGPLFVIEILLPVEIKIGSQQAIWKELATEAVESHLDWKAYMSFTNAIFSHV